MKYYIPISRRLFEHPFWCEERIFSRFEAWLDLIRSARFEETRQLVGGRFIDVGRGQTLISLRFLSSRWRWSVKKVHSFLELLEFEGMIRKETLPETRQTVLTVCNYDKYNTTGDETDACGKHLGNMAETLRKQSGNKIKKENKEKKEKIEKNKETPSAAAPEGEGLHTRARSLFEEHFAATFGSAYYWSARDAGGMSQLLKKITFTRERKELPLDDDSLLGSLRALLGSIRQGWIFEHFSVTNINSKYNEIIVQANHGNHRPNNQPEPGGICRPGVTVRETKL